MTTPVRELLDPNPGTQRSRRRLEICFEFPEVELSREREMPGPFTLFGLKVQASH